MRRNPEAIADAIREARTIAVCSHVNPDGDTLGSATAIRLALLETGKEVTLFCDGKVPDQMNFLPGHDLFRIPTESDGPFDLLLTVDISDLQRMGRCISLIPRCRHFAQIDHHPTNPLFAEINSVDGDAPANCVLIREQMKYIGAELPRDIAICLYTGLSTDTGNFSFSATNAETFEIMSELMKQGLPLSDLSRILFRERSRPQVLLMGKMLSGIRYYADGAVAVMKLSQQDFRDCGALSEHADTLVNIGLETAGTRMAILGRETDDGQIKFSLRAKFPERIDDIAQRFGGGGHPQASGLTLTGHLDEATDLVLRAMLEKIQ